MQHARARTGVVCQQAGSAQCCLVRMPPRPWCMSMQTHVHADACAGLHAIAALLPAWHDAAGTCNIAYPTSWRWHAPPLL
eukprot:364208-Chlamydomonas_euryale.AAC.8